jgi:hypothetical protein
MPNPLYLPTDVCPLLIHIDSEVNRIKFRQKIEKLLNRHSIKTKHFVSKNPKADLGLHSRFETSEQATKFVTKVIEVAMRDGYEVDK